MLWNCRQTIIKSFKVGERFNLNCSKYCDFMVKISMHDTSPSLQIKNEGYILHDNASSHVCKINYDFWKHKNFTDHHQAELASDRESMLSIEDESR